MGGVYVIEPQTTQARAGLPAGKIYALRSSIWFDVLGYALRPRKECATQIIVVTSCVPSLSFLPLTRFTSFYRVFSAFSDSWSHLRPMFY